MAKWHWETGIHWQKKANGEHILWDGDYKVGRVVSVFKGVHVEPYWEQGDSYYYFDTYEEGEAYLLATYQIEGKAVHFTN